jgi:protein involved in polysaccharide export with SLBB domain
MLTLKIPDNIIGMAFAETIPGNAMTELRHYFNRFFMKSPMKNKSIIMSIVFISVTVLFFLSGCVKRVPASTTNDKETVVSKEDFVKTFSGPNMDLIKQHAISRTPVLYPGDQVEIDIYDKLPVSQDKRVEMKRIGDDGSVFILPAKDIAIGGLTLSEAEKAIEKRLSEFIVSPFCEINIIKRAFEPRIYVFGEVDKSGVQMMKDGDRLLDALSGAGGCKSSTYRRSIKVIRLNDKSVSMISINLLDIMNEGKTDKNILMQDQDIVFVPRRFYTNLSEVVQIVAQTLPWYYFLKNFTF